MTWSVRRGRTARGDPNALSAHGASPGLGHDIVGPRLAPVELRRGREWFAVGWAIRVRARGLGGHRVDLLDHVPTGPPVVELLQLGRGAEVRAVWVPAVVDLHPLNGLGDRPLLDRRVPASARSRRGQRGFRGRLARWRAIGRIFRHSRAIKHWILRHYCHSINSY